MWTGWCPQPSEDLQGSQSAEASSQLTYGQYHITSFENNNNLDFSQTVESADPPSPVPAILLREGVLSPKMTIILCFMVMPVDQEDGHLGYPRNLVEKWVISGSEDRVFAFENEAGDVLSILYGDIERKEDLHNMEKEFFATKSGRPPTSPICRSNFDDHEIFQEPRSVWIKQRCNSEGIGKAKSREMVVVEGHALGP
ncbi:hypothetical protein EDC04DRAFT_2599526 [Pisolithus marmoratus]|nr:hypothetical protein EDC04DRAFT_2599526 [Pisolithus marmoratus]